MKDDYQQPEAYKPVMAGLLAGIFSAIACIIYDGLYRSATGFPLSELINVSTIIFGVLLVLVLAGSIFAVLDKYVRHGLIVYIVLFIILTLLGVRFALHVTRSDNPVLASEFHGLFLGIVVISGTAASFIVPYFAKHDTFFL